MGSRTDRELKFQALELLEWALDDLTPPGEKRRLHFKCGFEREGHFIPETLHDPSALSGHQWHVHNSGSMTVRGENMDMRMREDPHTDEILKEVYCDHAGTFMLEAVTKPLGLKESVEAMDYVSRRMMAVAEDFDFRAKNFGPLVVGPVVKELMAKVAPDEAATFLEAAFTNYAGEVFPLADGDTLVGRGQHCNISIWCGKTNLFRRVGSPTGSLDLVHPAADKALDWLPYMFLPCREGNYHRIAAGSTHGVHAFSIGDIDSKKTGYVLRYTADKKFRGHDEGSYRLEFRQGASEADALDLALASATPLVKACEESLVPDTIKGVVVREVRPFPAGRNQPVPKSEEEAKALFASEENPYFRYLDTLAERKLERARQQYEAEPTAANEQAMRRAREVQHIGSRLFEAYCQEYGIEAPVAERPPASRLR